MKFFNLGWVKKFKRYDWVPVNKKGEREVDFKKLPDSDIEGMTEILPFVHNLDEWPIDGKFIKDKIFERRLKDEGRLN